jgi:glycosyltransferase involved in cell wall biosynthesis
MRGPVLFMIPSLGYGGAEILLIQQVNWLKDNGWQCFVAVLCGSNEPARALVNQLSLPPEQIIIFRSKYSVLNFSSFSFALRHYKELASFAQKNNIKNIVAHLPMAHFWARLVKQKMPVARLIVYHHSMQYQANPLNSVPKKLFNGLQKILARKTDNVSVCISEAVKENIAAHFVVRNPVILYNAVPDSGPIKLSTHADQPGKNIRLILPGRLHVAKGHLFFLEVFKRIVKEYDQPVHLEIAGGGYLQKAIEEFIDKHQLQQCVTITGFLSNDDLLSHIANADLVMIPSISEGLGIVGIEALMLGKTVIASNAGGLKEVFKDGQNGYVFEAGNVESCLNVVLSVLSNFPAYQLSPANLREEYEKKFSFNGYIKKFEALLT